MRDLVERVRQLLWRPRQSLPLTLAESGSARSVVGSYVVWLAAIGPLALFLSDGLIGAWHAPTTIFNTIIPGGWVRAPRPALVEMLLAWALGIGAWAMLSTAMTLVGPRFGGLSDLPGAHKAAAYTLTPLYVAGAAWLFGSVPYLTWLPGVALVAGVAWAAFLGSLALPLHLGTPDPRAPGHALVSLAITAAGTTLAYYLISLAVYAIWSSRIS
jgi:hypothetical protein